MNKAEMIDSIAKSAKLTKVKSKEALDSIMAICYKNIGLKVRKFLWWDSALSWFTRRQQGKEEILKPGRKLKYPPGKLSNSRQAKVLKRDRWKSNKWPRVPGAICFYDRL